MSSVPRPTLESASVFIPDDVYLFSLGLLDIGGRFGPLSELFSQAVNLNFDRDADDDDAEQVLNDLAISELGKLGQLKDGRARAKKLSHAERSRLAAKVAQ